MSNEIDWNKAPGWADRVVVGQISKALYWASHDCRKSIRNDEIYHGSLHINEGRRVAEWRPAMKTENAERFSPINTAEEIAADEKQDLWLAEIAAEYDQETADNCAAVLVGAGYRKQATQCSK